MADKLFHELTLDEATDLASECVSCARSEEEIRRSLTEAGFNAAAAAIASHGDGRNFQATINVWGPNNEAIRVDGEVVRT